MSAVMQNFEFKRPTRKCSVADRALLPGEKFYSALIEVDGQLERADYCEENWQGPPEDCLGWWTSKIPELSKGRVYWAPNDILLAYFEHAINQPAEPDTAYLTALLLVRKKILRLLETRDDQEPQVLILKHMKSKEVYEVPVVEIEPNRILEIQQTLNERLFTDQAPSAANDEDE